MTRGPEVMVSPTGARRTKRDHPALPMATGEIVAAATACAAAGATALHLHIRDDAGRHSLDAGRYAETLSAVAAAAPSLALQVTTESAGIFDAAAQLDCLRRLRPAWASASVREIDAATSDAFYGFCAAEGVRLQHILFDRSDIATLSARRASGVVRPGQDEVIFVLGAYAERRAGRPADLDALRSAAARDWRWSVCAFGREEQACLIHAAETGAHGVRVGFENNLERPDGAPWRDNADAVAALVDALRLRLGAAS